MAETGELPSSLQIEHIMPQRWTANWQLPSETQDREAATTNRDRLLHTFGNLTLVTGRLNSTLSNAPRESKKETSERHTVLFLNRSLLEHPPEIWNEDAIQERSRVMWELAIREWPSADLIRA